MHFIRQETLQLVEKAPDAKIEDIKQSTKIHQNSPEDNPEMIARPECGSPNVRD